MIISHPIDVGASFARWVLDARLAQHCLANSKTTTANQCIDGSHFSRTSCCLEVMWTIARVERVADKAERPRFLRFVNDIRHPSFS